MKCVKFVITALLALFCFIMRKGSSSNQKAKGVTTPAKIVGKGSVGNPKLSRNREGRLAGAGLDCVEDEAASVTRALLETPNVVITPHIGGSTADLADAMVENIAGKIQALSEGRDVENVVNRACLSPAR